MTFTEFLAALAQALEDSSGLPSGPEASSVEPIPRVSYDPTRREATAPDEMLIGVGH